MLAEGLRRLRRSGRLFAVSAGLSLAVFIAAAAAQSDRYAFQPDAVELDHPAVGYRLASRTDAVSRLDQKLRAGTATLTFDGASGYLRSLLSALDIPVESPIAVFSKTSLQAPLINPSNPRTIFFNDSVAVAWMLSSRSCRRNLRASTQATAVWAAISRRRPKECRDFCCEVSRPRLTDHAPVARQRDDGSSDPGC